MKVKKTFEWSNNKFYDFVFDNIIVEMDGSFHLGNKYYSYEEVKEIDNLKDKLALENGYNLIRVDCYKSDFLYIKENLYKTKLKTVLDLDMADWIKLEQELITNNLVKMACDTYNKYKGNILLIDMAKKLNIYEGKLRSLLKIGARIGLTDYNEKVSTSGGYIPKNTWYDSRKKIICIETNQKFFQVGQVPVKVWENITAMC